MITTIALILAATALRPHGAEATPRDVSVRPLPPSGVASSVTIDAMPYTRTVSCGSYTLTGTFTGATPTWSASPSGASGSCSDTGGGTFSCVVDVDPDATGEGVETITVTNGASDTETIGFYVEGEHSCFLAQSIDGSYNSTLANLDAVTTWENLGSSALDVTQPGAATLKPTYRTGIVGGQPVVRCDGGDRVAATTASDWIFLHDGNGSTVDVVLSLTNTGTNTIAATYTSGGNQGISYRTLTTAQSSLIVANAAGAIINAVSANNVFAINTFNGHTFTLASATSPDSTQYINGTSVRTADASAAYGTGNPQGPLNLCSTVSGTNFATGDLFRVNIYASELTSTQRGINKAVDEWALGGTLPVTP